MREHKDRLRSYDLQVISKQKLLNDLIQPATLLKNHDLHLECQVCHLGKVSITLGSNASHCPSKGYSWHDALALMTLSAVLDLKLDTMLSCSLPSLVLHLNSARCFQERLKQIATCLVLLAGSKISHIQCPGFQELPARFGCQIINLAEKAITIARVLLISKGWISYRSFILSS